jgi:ribosomal protein S18 acetylase RimI-like enzyme
MEHEIPATRSSSRTAVAPRVWVAGDGDLDLVSELIAEFRDWWGKSDPSVAGIRRTVRALLDDPATEFLLGARDGDAAASGVCQLRYRLSVWTGTEDCWLEDLYVRADARRAGVGRALVDASLERARTRGCRRIELDVNEENVEALRFYRSLGFATEPKPPGRTLFIARRLD